MIPTRYAPQHAPSKEGNPIGARITADRFGTRQTGRQRLNHKYLSFVLAALFGLSIIFYPAAAHWLSLQNQTRQLTHYSALVSNSESLRILEAAKRYNQELTIFDPAEYSNQLLFEGTSVMAALRVPAVGIHLPIYHGTSDQVLLRGVGHVEASHLPVGGSGTNSVLTAHTGLPGSSMFDSLHSVEVGDAIVIAVGGKELFYKVSTKEVLDPEMAEQRAAARQGGDLLTLVTCTPYSVNSHRLVVTAERVAEKDSVPQKEFRTHGGEFPLWLVLYTVGVAGILGLAYISSLPGRQQGL